MKSKTAKKRAQKQAPMDIESIGVQEVQQQVPTIQPVTNVQQQQQMNTNIFSNQIPQQQQQVQYTVQPKFMPPSNMQMPVQQMQMPVQQMQQQQMNNVYQQAPQSRNVRGGMYGRQMQQQSYQIPGIFNDDQPLIEKVKQQTGEKAKIDFTIKAQRTMVKLKEETILPAMCSIQSSGGTRSSVDLICVIDISGSMSGQKIQLVRQTMKVLLETLTDVDRLSIITFNSSGQRVCPLKCVGAQNMVGFNEHVNRLQAGGGTNIMSGMNLALKTIRDRKVPNKVTSVFLLSDGQDKGSENSFKQTLESKDNQQLGVFSVHSFGFGNDHDEDTMNKICELKDGSFYFIKQLATLDEAFCNALGGIISLVASQVTIKVNNISKGLVEGIRISKTFGDKWTKINDREYKIKLTQLMSGVSKDYVFELIIPAISAEVGDLEREHEVIEGIMSAKGLNQEMMNSQYCLKLALLNQNQEIPEVNENVDVIENYLRVKATEVIEQNMKKAENQQYDEAQKGIDTMINSIQTNKKARKEKMVHLVEDLQQIREKCSKNEFQNQGRKWMVNAKNAHTNMQSYQYANCVQQQMVSNRKAQKKC